MQFVAYSNSILDNMPEPLLVLSHDMKVQFANQSFYRTFKVKKEQTTDKLIYDLGNGQWNIPDLRRLLSEILPENTSFDNFIVEHDFPGIGKRTIALFARRLQSGDRESEWIMLVMKDMTEKNARTAVEEEDAACRNPKAI